MAELDEQLARLAAQRGDTVPPLDPSAARVRARRNTRRRAAWVTGIAACVVALLVAGGFAVFGGSDGSPSVRTPSASTGAPAPTTAPPTTAPRTTAAPTTTTPPACPPLDGADLQAKAGGSTGTTSVPVFVGVQVQASQCTDVILLEFGGGTPGWSAAYEASATGAGEGLLVLRFTSDMTMGSEPEPTELRPSEPSRILGIQGIPQVYGSSPVSINLSSQGSPRAFRVVPLNGALAIEITRVEGDVAVTGSVVCRAVDQHLQFEVPTGWYVDVTPDQRPCTRFAPQPFIVCGACDGPFPWGAIGVSSQAPQPSSPAFETVVSSTPTTVAGRAGTGTEVAATGNGLFPADYRTYEYTVDWSPDGVLGFWIGGDPGPDFDVRRAALDAIAASVRHLG